MQIRNTRNRHNQSDSSTIERLGQRMSCIGQLRAHLTLCGISEGRTRSFSTLTDHCSSSRLILSATSGYCSDTSRDSVGSFRKSNKTLGSVESFNFVPRVT